MKHFLVLVIIISCCIQGNAQIKSKKFSSALQEVIAKKSDKETIDVLLSVKDLSQIHRKEKIQILNEYAPSQTALVRLKIADLNELVNSDEIVFADTYRKPVEELTTGALEISLNKISFSHNQFPFITGDSIFASIKEQRFDTNDIDIKGRYFNSNVAAPSLASHASIMTTMLAGGANTSPFAKGAAWGSYVTSSDFASLLPDADSVYQKYKITIQNHSYGTGIENYYGADAAAFDLSTKNNPSLLHVFSAGNSGTLTSTSGPYTGVQGFANITGSFKMAKNIITVGATDSFNHVVIPSSKGPAFDGRVKPELVAFGEDGSSGAAALVSGSVALVQQAYKRNYNNSLPSNALTKAVLLNSADDIEKPHVDYLSGYGSLNTYHAVKTIIENRFLENSIAQNEVKNFAFTIPPNTALAKFTVVWMDVPAQANAAKALVNDIDAQVQLPATGGSWLPWVLNPVATVDSLLLPAQRKLDTLNTVEQITVDNPAPGNYILQIKGNKIQSGPTQSFAIAYQFDTVGHFVWTYPSSTSALTAATRNVIRWESNIDDTATVEYSFNGVQWQALAHAVDLKNQYYQWITPDTNSTAFLRIKIPAYNSIVASDSFTISRILNLRVGFNCPDSFLLYWYKLPVSQYQLYELGQKYLQPVIVTADTMAVFSKKQFIALHYAVAPLINSKTGLRSFTTNYTTQGVACYISSFLAELQNNTALISVQLGTTYNIASISAIRTNSVGIKTIQTMTPPLSLTFNWTDSNLVRGANAYQLAIKLTNGIIIYSSAETVYYLPDNPVIIYPNPTRQNEPVKIITSSPGIYSITVYDTNGRTILMQGLDDIYQQLPALRLSKGIYFVKMIPQNGKPFVQKLVVY
jgi:hypothetical protein